MDLSSLKIKYSSNYIILYVGSELFREDYARIYITIYKELIFRKLSVVAILGPGSTVEVEKRFRNLNPLKLENILAEYNMARKNRMAVSLKLLTLFFRSLYLGRIPFSKRNPFELLNRYLKFRALYRFLSENKPRLILSIKYSSCYEFVEAANSIGIKTIAIQHGEGYLSDESLYRKRFHEWPASILLVWSEYWREYHSKNYPGQASYYTIDSILWHARYNQTVPRKSNKIIIYESIDQLNTLLQTLIDEIIKVFPSDILKVKAHPWKKDNNVSIVTRRYPNLMDCDELWDVVPRIGVSFGSTIGNELIFNDCPVINICLEPEEIGFIYPKTGSFLYREDSKFPIPLIIQLLTKLYLDDKFSQKFLLEQKEQLKKYLTSSNPEKQIVQFCMKA
jgi:hypothetical protein